MADYTRQLAADVANPTTVDNNAKAEGGAEPPMVQVALWQDKFGSAFDAAHWTKSGLLSYLSAVAAGSAVEAGDVLPIIAGPGQNAYRDYGVYSDQLFTGDFDVHIDCNAITWDLDTTWQQIGLAVYSDSAGAPDTNNGIRVDYHKKTGTFSCYAFSIVAGVPTWSGATNVTSNSPKLRIVRSGTTITTYYDDGAGWVQKTQYAGTGFGSVRVVIDANTFRIAKSITVPVNEFIQTSGGVYWDDSPEADIVDSVNIGGGESYAFDAAVGKVWTLTGASSVEDGDGGTNKWKVGFSDAADGTGVTWDAAWRTIAQVNTNASNGNYDGHRYLYVKWQGNSDGSQNVNATSFTISGTAAVPTHTWSRSSTEKKEGSYSFKQVGPAALQNDDYYMQEIDTVLGEDYYVEVFAKCTVAPTSGYFYLEVYGIGAGESLRGRVKLAVQTSGFVKLAFYFNLIAGTADKAEVRIGGDVKGGTIYWDCCDSKRIRVKGYS